MEIVNGGSGLSLSYNGVTEFVAYNSIKTISPLQLRGDFYIVLHFTTEIVDSLKINLAKVTNQPTWTNDVVGIQTAVDDIINWIGLSGGGVQVDWNELDSSSDAFIKNKPTKLSDFTDDLTHPNLANSDQNITDNVRVVKVQGTTSDKMIKFINGSSEAIVEFLSNRQVNTYGSVQMKNTSGNNLFTFDNTEMVSYRNSRYGNAASTQYHTMGGSTAADKYVIRNSSGLEILKIAGDGNFVFSKTGNNLQDAFSVFSDGRMFMTKNGNNFIELNPSGGYYNRFYFPLNGLEIELGNKSMKIGTSTSFFSYFSNTLQVTSVLHTTSGATRAFLIENGVAPSTNLPNCYWSYSADQVAGNACPHFMTEAGQIIKLFSANNVAQPTGGATQDTECRTAVNAILALLQANGLML